MFKRALALILSGFLILPFPAHADEVIADLKEESVPVLNEELRQVNSDVKDVEASVAAVQADVDAIVSSRVLQVKYGSSATYDSCSVACVAANDDSIPQYSEGKLVTSVSITPSNASNILHIRGVFHGTGSTAGDSLVVHVHNGTTADAVQDCVGTGYGSATTITQSIPFSCKVTAGGTSSITFNLVASHSDSNTMNINGAGGARKYGGALASSITVTEVTP